MSTYNGWFGLAGRSCMRETLLTAASHKGRFSLGSSAGPLEKLRLAARRKS